MSIPRLELMVTLTGLRLTLQISRALGIPTSKATFWVQMSAFGFRDRAETTKPFVSHRVGKVDADSSPDQLRYFPTKLNPADKGTRGVLVQELIKDDCRWHGP